MFGGGEYHETSKILEFLFLGYCSPKKKKVLEWKFLIRDVVYLPSNSKRSGGRGGRGGGVERSDFLAVHATF